MLKYVVYWVWWFTWRLLITLACMITIHNVIEQEGYRIEWSTLAIATVCTIVAIRIWMPTYKHEGL